MEHSVSVIIPFFNSSSTLQRALQSVFLQTAQVREIIVVDDASTLNERNQACELVRNYSNAKIISLDRNTGAANARNFGWNLACGEWVAFLDSDDAWHPRKIEIQLRHALERDPQPSLVATRTIEQTTLSDFMKMKIDHTEECRTITKSQLLIKNRMSTPSVMIRREVKERFRAGRRFSEDFELWLILAGKGFDMIKVDLPLTAIFKAPYGDSGLSSHMFAMALGECKAFVGAAKTNAISPFEAIFGLVISIMKSARRIVMSRRSRISSSQKQSSIMKNHKTGLKS